MAERSEQTIPPTGRQLAAARRFVTRHGRPSKAVVENIGLAGARLVLVGADGTLGDVFVPAVATGEALAVAVDGLELTKWDNETVQSLEIGATLRRRMAGH